MEQYDARSNRDDGARMVQRAVEMHGARSSMVQGASFVHSESDVKLIHIQHHSRVTSQIHVCTLKGTCVCMH